MDIAPLVKTPVRPFAPSGRWKSVGVCLLLVAMVWGVFGQALSFEFINYDDPEYVYENPEITGGLSLSSVRWAFTHIHSSNWHPLTTLSHIFDCEVYGLQPWGHHLGNVLLHGAAAILLFLALKQMTQAFWRSALVAAIFAIHPLRAESVAWVSERKDVLSGLFFMLSLLAYARYAQAGKSKGAYAALLLFFAMGLMCKPSLVTLPCVLLLLDWWPLGRLELGAGWKAAWSSAKPLVIEKLPLFALTAASCVATSIAQTEAMVPLENCPMGSRMGNALVSYAVYLLQMLWPRDMAAVYPNNLFALALWKIGAALLALLVVSTAAWRMRKRFPWLMMSWLWYLGMLVPMIGIVQVGDEAHADRYTYLTQIGLYMALVWTCASLARSQRWPRWMLGGVSATVLAILAIVAWKQTSYWHDSETLWKHTLECTDHNAKAYNNLGSFFFRKGRLEQAIPFFQMALQIKPDNADLHYNIGTAFCRTGQLDQGIAHFQRALRNKPQNPDLHYNLGTALCQTGQLNQAISHLQMAVQIKPDYAAAHNNLGEALRQNGKVDQAIAHFQTALKIKPENAAAYNNLIVAFTQKGELEEALACYQKVLEFNPTRQAAENCAMTQNNLAYILATSQDPTVRNGAKALVLAQKASQILGEENPHILDTLAAAYAEMGRYAEAVETARRALAQAGQEDVAFSKALQKRLELYQAGQPLRAKP